MSAATDLAECLARAYDGTRDPDKRDQFHAVTTGDGSQYIVTMVEDTAVMWVMYRGELHSVTVTAQRSSGEDWAEDDDAVQEIIDKGL